MNLSALLILFEIAREVFKIALIYLGMGISLLVMSLIPLIVIYKTMKVIRRDKIG